MGCWDERLGKFIDAVAAKVVKERDGKLQVNGRKQKQKLLRLTHLNANIGGFERSLFP